MNLKTDLFLVQTHGWLGLCVVCCCVGAPGCTIAVSNLPSSFGDEEVSTAFSPFGSIVWAKVVEDRREGGRSVKGELDT